MYILLVLLGYILPMTLFIIGLIFSKYPPKKINSFSGYRTTRSMKNIDTWNEANKYSSKLLLKLSLLLLAVTTFGIILAGNSFDLMAVVILSSVVLGVILVIVTIIKTESHLKKEFGI